MIIKAEQSFSAHRVSAGAVAPGWGPGAAGAPWGGGWGWYCAKTKPKQDHIAAAGLRHRLGLEVFSPRLRSEQTTIRGVVKRITEPVFPGYVFVRCFLDEHIGQIRHISGISGLVSFGGRIPQVPAEVLEDLRRCFGVEELLPLRKDPRPGDEVTVTRGAFMGMQALVLQSWPARRRVQILLEILGRPTPVEMDRRQVSLPRDSVAEWLPELARA